MPWETILDGLDEPERSDMVDELAGTGMARPAAVDVVDEAIRSGELDVGPSGFLSRGGAASRQTNCNKCGNPARESDAPELILRAREMADQFREEYPDRADQPLTTVDGTSIRREYAHIDYEEWEAETGAVRCDIDGCGVTFGSDRRAGHFVEEHGEIVEKYGDVWAAASDLTTAVDDATGDRVTDVTAGAWAEAVGLTAYKFLRTKRTAINLRKGEPGTEGYATHTVRARNRWFKSYQKRYFARLNGWLRELTGGERPSGETVEGEFENPHIALLTRSVSSTPDGRRIGPVEVFERLAESRRPVYQRLRYDMEKSGWEGDEWQYTWVEEPHTSKRGGGTNAAYPHEHEVLVVDGEVSPSDLKPVMEKHVAETPGASMDAHRNRACEEHYEGDHWDDADPECEECQVSVNVRPADDVENVAKYVADYASVDPEEFTERSPAYHGFAAAASASNRRTFQMSDPAKWAADADMCRQRYESEKAMQSVGHGEEIRRKNGRVVCERCESPHGIDQDRTLSARRLDADAWTPDAAADGGETVPDRESDLRGRWPSADAAATVGEPPERRKLRTRVERVLENGTDPDPVSVSARLAGGVLDPDPETVRGILAEIEHPEYDPSEPVGFDVSRPEWRVHSVTVDGEEHMASGGGVEKVEVRNVSQRLRDALRVDHTAQYRCRCGTVVHGSSVVSHIRTHGIADPEVAREVVSRGSVVPD